MAAHVVCVCVYTHMPSEIPVDTAMSS